MMGLHFSLAPSNRKIHKIVTPETSTKSSFIVAETFSESLQVLMTVYVLAFAHMSSNFDVE